MFCPKCGSPNEDAAVFCAKCGGALRPDGGTTTRTPPIPPQERENPPTGKNPTVALVVSIFLGGLGGGQFYNGDWKKGLAMAAGTVFLSVPTGGLVAFGVWVWSMIDAWQVASGKWKPW